MEIKVTVDDAVLSNLLNGREMVDVLTQVSTSINAAARTYTGVFTGELYDSMQYAVSETTTGAEATLGSGAEDNNPVAQAALNWYGHEDPNGLTVREDYPRWEPDHEVKPHPTRPYEKALEELGVEYTVAPEWIEWAKDGGKK